MKKNIVLIGFMGAGKSMASNELAKRLSRKVLSTDALIKKKERRPIVEIFRDSGEDYFRRLEEEVIQDISSQNSLIIDCGGGVFLNEKNQEQLGKNGISFYLSASPEVLYERTKNKKHRPLLNTENPKQSIKELLAQREPFYRKANYCIDTNNKSNKQVCDEIEKLLPHE